MSGRSSYRVTAPPVALSIARTFSAGTPPRALLSQKDTSCCLTPIFSAKAACEPQISIARANPEDASLSLMGKEATQELVSRQQENTYRPQQKDFGCDTSWARPEPGSMRTLGSRLRIRREQLGWSQTELARRISDIVSPRGKKFTQQSVHNLESGRSRNSSELPVVADVLKVSLEWLRDGKGPQPGMPSEAPTVAAQSVSASSGEDFYAALEGTLLAEGREPDRIRVFLGLVREVVSAPLNAPTEEAAYELRRELARLLASARLPPKTEDNE